ncbi:hypothetical protein WI75_25570 [Burkholderia ubonensis]|nr:hypothetical protein WI75_25570 [Burkholderia ubonensis]
MRGYVSLVVSSDHRRTIVARLSGRCLRVCHARCSLGAIDPVSAATDIRLRGRRKIDRVYAPYRARLAFCKTRFAPATHRLAIRLMYRRLSPIQLVHPRRGTRNFLHPQGSRIATSLTRPFLHLQTSLAQ